MSYYDSHLGAKFTYSPDNYWHTYKDFRLYPREKPIISPPKVKSLTVDIPGADGELDFTQALTGDVHYENRKGTFKYSYFGKREMWDALWHRILSNLHGQRVKIELDEDPGGYYEGRVFFQEPQYDDDGKMFIEIEGDLEPYKKDSQSSLEPWIWDTFSFENGVIRDYANIQVNGTTSLQIVGSKMPYYPDIIVKSGTVSVAYYVDGVQKTVSLVSGSNATRTPDLVVRYELKTLTFTGNGVVDVEYRGGTL